MGRDIRFLPHLFQKEYFVESSPDTKVIGIHISKGMISKGMLEKAGNKVQQNKLIYCDIFNRQSN